MTSPGRTKLQAATADIHARLHDLPAFLALLDGRLPRDSYRDLLAQLWGFHAPLDRHLAEHGDGPRLARLRADLVFLGLPPTAIEALPCAAMSELPGRGPAALGAAYVRDGSMLGGTLMARALDPLLGPGSLEGRRFFTPGTDSAARWRACLAAVERMAGDPGALDIVIEGAKTTFAIFERHMSRMPACASAALAD